MAHQHESIPWTVISSNLEYRHVDPNHEDITNLYPLHRPNQAQQLNNFVTKFVAVPESQASTESNKHDHKNVPSDEDIVISNDVVARIGPDIHRARSRWLPDLSRKIENVYVPSRSCRHQTLDICTCPLSLDDRKTKSLLAVWQHRPVNDAFFGGEAVYLRLETFKALVLHGQMAPLVQLCSHPDADFHHYWSELRSEVRSQYVPMPRSAGWEQLAKTALQSYLCLNILVCYPELCNDKLGRNARQDYRNTSAYQTILRHFVESVPRLDLPYISHQHFFGIADRREHRPSSPHPCSFSILRTNPPGKLSFNQLLDDEKNLPYVPHWSDLDEVRIMFSSFGLPTEIALEIFKFADYAPRRHLRVANDPLHHRNREELTAYLTSCWRTIVCCEVTANALGKRINWNNMIIDTIFDLFLSDPQDISKGSMRKMVNYTRVQDRSYIDHAVQYMGAFA